MTAAVPAAVAGHTLDTVATLATLLVVAAAVAAIALRRSLGGRPDGEPEAAGARPHARRPRPIGALALAGAGVLVVAAVAIAAVNRSGGSASPQAQSAQDRALETNPNLDPGLGLSRPAPGFTLNDQFGRRVSLRSYRGKVVLLAFTDSRCTTVCPLTTTAMVDARAMLGRAGADVALVGVDANPLATATRDVWSYSETHGMLHSWEFLTASRRRLEHVWKSYGIAAQVIGGQIDHTAALFVISPTGVEAKVYVTQMSYAAIGQLGQLLATEAARLLPGHPAVDSHLSYARAPATAPTTRTSLPAAGGGSVPLGPGPTPRLLVFFASWDREVTNLGSQLVGLDRYQALARREGLPPVTAVDEASVDPSGELSRFLARLPGRLSYPVAVDRTGAVADGYEAQDLPWYVLVSVGGRLLWYRDASVAGWLSPGALAAQVRAALARVPHGAASAAGQARDLAGSPAPLAAVHRQADKILGGESALMARIRALRGYPIVVNAWGSWCDPCRAEAGLLASAAARYGRRVAFLGADVSDDVPDAEAFLRQHPVSYPSYELATDQFTGLLTGGLQSTPTTIFIGPSGRVAYVHIGVYLSGGTLDSDIQTHLLGGG